MNIRDDFPYPIHEIEHLLIPLSDGVRLAARIWLPVDATEQPVPAILEYIPYRKNDSTAFRDSIRHPYFAGHGYASVRVDMRGSGDSDGILYDEYLPQEQDDALEVMAWLAAQPWCNGQVGIIGKSWGGFNGLQIAARRPPQLKAVISIYSTDDRYADDVHFRGGCLLACDMLPWASRMFVMNGLPPDPRNVGEAWREMWLDRLQRTPPFIEAWMSHQTRDAFWKHGSVGDNFSDITCPVYAVGGWADAYTNAVPRLLEGLPGPRKGLIGPWAHEYPEVAIPGPAIGFLQECLRWWDYWLKGIDTGIMDEPMLRVWLQDSVEPGPYYRERPGRWVTEPTWPSPHLEKQTYWLNRGTLDDAPAAARPLQYLGSQFAGADAGVWCPYGDPVEMPPDQRAEDGLALSFESAPLQEPVEILGFPEVILTIAADRPNALVVVRLCDVAPTGSSLLVSRGFLNLTHRESHEQPSPVEPGQRYTVRIRLDVAGHKLLAGHRWRLSVSPTYWPQAWPSPEPVTLTIFTGAASQLTLPVRPPRAEDGGVPPFEPPESSPPLKFEQVESHLHKRFVQRDIGQKTLELVDVADSGRKKLLPHGLEFYSQSKDVFTITEADPLSAAIRCKYTMELQRDAWQIRIETSSTMSADAEAFYITNVIDAYEGNTRIFTKARDTKVPRQLV
jgi:putative CocE/NonD family hydrolase